MKKHIAFAMLLAVLIVGCKKNESPSVSITEPDNNTEIERGEQIDIKVSASDPDQAVVLTKLYINGELVVTESIPEFTYNWNTLLSSTGTFNIKAVTTDDEGLEATDEIIVTIVEYIPPTISVSPYSASGFPNDTIEFTISCSGIQQLTQLEITPNMDASQGVSMNSFSDDYSFTKTYTYIIPSSATGDDNISIQFQIFDSMDLTAYRTCIIDVMAPEDTITYQPISVANDIVLGTYSHPSISSYYDAHNQIVYNVSAITDGSEIDFVYYYGTTNNATICAPDDVVILNYGLSDYYACKDWEVQNPTRFKVVYGFNWDDITTDELILQYATDLTASSVTQLNVGDMIAFETADGKKGIFKVTDIECCGSGSITIDVKFQQ